MKRLNLFALAVLAAVALATAGCGDHDQGNGDEDHAMAPAASTGSVTIISPKEGAVLPSGSEDKLTYNVTLGPNGNHLHVYVDNDPPIIDRNVSDCPCSLDLPKLTEGPHTIAVKEATASHALTGVQKTVHFTVK
ncbi:MAG TPA: hypothetical protein VJ961_10255 [Mariprofundaceae bacterium]|nr:hypothetical protein [Mariprofundaceae bacterium]